MIVEYLSLLVQKYYSQRIIDNNNKILKILEQLIPILLLNSNFAEACGLR